MNQTYVCTFSKQGLLRFISHLDLQSLWELALRRSGLPIAYTQGFHPHQRFAIAIPLPLGVASSCELLELFLSESRDERVIIEALNRVLPEGIVVSSVVACSGKRVMSTITSLTYEFVFTHADYALVGPVFDSAMHNPSHVIERAKTKKMINIKDYILAVEKKEPHTIAITCRFNNEGSVRINELLTLMSGFKQSPSITRTHIALAVPA